jgi:hypothetical protein
MARAETRTWYRVALARVGTSPQQAKLVAAAGTHIGEAILDASRHLPDSWAVGVDTALDADIPLGESVGKGHVVQLGEAEVATTYRWPTGVVPRLGQDAALTAARTGFCIVTRPDLFVIEAQCTSDMLVDVFLGIVERMPSADNLEVRVLDHFEAADSTDVWLTSRVNARKVIALLDDHDELIENGHLELSVYARAQHATLRLTEHKTVVWLAADRTLEADVVRWFGELGVRPVESLVTVRAAAHFHYRTVSSRNRTKLAEELYRQRFRKVDVLKAASTQR